MDLDLIELGNDALTLALQPTAAGSIGFRRLACDGAAVELDPEVAPVELQTPDDQHRVPVQRLNQTGWAAALRYQGHRHSRVGNRRAVTVELAADPLAVQWELSLRSAAPAFTSQVSVANRGTANVRLTAVASLSMPVTGLVGQQLITAAECDLVTGRSDWLAENRWTHRPLRDSLVDLCGPDHPDSAKGAHVARSLGSWSTGGDLPAGVLAARGAYAIGWQIEHNGAWRWELGEDPAGVTLTLSGPLDPDHQWSAVLAPGESFTSVPVTVSFGADWQDAVAGLTAHRRAVRRPHRDNSAPAVVYNDYMNTLMGDPTTTRLLPLIEGAHQAGADVFCIDAGWYDDNLTWWDSVGEWHPSTTRFPGGLRAVVDRIRQERMVPGLWLEPEVIGVRSPMADRLPAEAFFSRWGRRVREAGRFHLDLRHPAARGHLDGVVDRLVEELGIGYFKFDYNINPGPGTDHDAASAGAGLLGHNRALLDWLDAVAERHPELIIENCGSGAMRCDFAMLSRLQLQSTSDQQDSARYAPIAAAAPMLILPEQAGSWAYPAAEMSLEETAFTLQAGMLGRLYLSGHLGLLSAEQADLVRQAVRVHRGLAAEISTAVPRWPLGLPDWAAEEVALLLRGDGSALLTVWKRSAGPAEIRLPLPYRMVEPLFPTSLPGWHWATADGAVIARVEVPGISARTVRLR